MEIRIKAPMECTPIELEQFKQLVVSGGQVDIEGLLDRIKQCRVLAFYYSEDNQLVGVSAIKQKTMASVKKVQDKATVAAKEIPLLELGYSFTKKEFRGKGVNRMLNDQLLEKIGDVSIFATTDNDIMREYLKSRGFSKKGNSFKGKYNEELDYFEKKKNK